MEYGLIVKQEDLDVFDKNDLEYSFYDGFDFFSSEDSEQLKNNKIEVIFENEYDRDEAIRLIHSR